MKLYEINEELDRLLENAFDDETGEYFPEAIEAIEELQKEKGNIMEWIAKKVFNYRSDVAALTTEISRLGAMKNTLNKKIDGLLEMINQEANGERMDFSVGYFTYRKSKAVIVDDDKALKNFLRFEHPELLKVTEEVNKVELKNLMKTTEVPYCHIEERRKGNLK